MSRSINRPAEEIGFAGEKADIQSVSGRKSILGHTVWNKRNKSLLVVTVSRKNYISGACREGIRSAVVVEDRTDGTTRSVDVIPATGSSKTNPKPVVANGLVCINDNIVSLACLDD